MKRTIIFLLTTTVLMLANLSLAQTDTYYLHVGALYPKATDNGLILGFGLAHEFDERVDLGINLDYFNVLSRDETKIGWDYGNGTIVDSVFTNFESRVIMFPISANVTIRFPLEMPLIPFISGHLGYSLLWNKFDNYITDDSETKFFGGAFYKASAGAIYKLGTKSAMTFEIYHNWNIPSHREDETAGLPTRNEIDMSGLGFQAGLRLTK
jgi:hypothetical protein